MASFSALLLLPSDSLEEILCRIPIEYLIRLQLVCKQWQSLFKNQRFIYTHLDFVEERFIRIDNMVEIFEPVAQTRIISPLPDEFPEKPRISYLVQCDGLLLLTFDNTRLKDFYAIWNPILGKIKWIQLRHRVSDRYDNYGIGYNNVSREGYKILRFCNRINEVEMEIYDIKSNSWSNNNVSLDWSRERGCAGVSVNGNMYWLAHKITDDKIFIQSFDFSSETFKPISDLPNEPYLIYDDDTMVLSCFKRDRLSLLHQSDEAMKIEIWVSNKVNEEVISWSKYLSVAIPDWLLLYTCHRFFIDKNDKIRVYCHEMTDDGANDYYGLFEISKDGTKKEADTGRFSSCVSYVYVPSFVSLPL